METAAETAQKQTPQNGRGNKTRRMIMQAAKQVFAMHPYNAASLRMIAAQGDFYHGLIRYHFPNKAQIFEAVAEEACLSLYYANKEWLMETQSLSPAKGLPLYLDRVIDYCKGAPEVFRIIVQNLSHEDLEFLPGYHHLTALLDNTRKDFETMSKGLFSSIDARRFLNSLNALIMHYFGAGAVEADIIGLEPYSEEYYQWVKETLIFLLLPVLQKAYEKRSDA